ncbi:MAG: hypothetical protein LC803_16925 [Acidobacteria bacterium]|nr:hypothetical protein [Acidobacteriota bacterium]
MNTNKKTLLLLLCALAAVTVTAMATLRSQNQQAATHQGQQKVEIDDSHWPLADYHAVEPSDAKTKMVRKTRGKRYDNWNVIDGASQRPGVTITSEIEYPALPVADSDVVLIGEVTEARAYLSNDKSGVYSEFTTRVCEVMKQDLQVPVNREDFVTTERAGGRVRYLSGRVAKVKFQGWGMPHQGRKYLLFLKRNAERQNYTILTGYELRSGKVYPIDGAVAAVGNKKWPFDSYQEADQNRFLSDLQKEIANPTQKAVIY